MCRAHQNQNLGVEIFDQYSAWNQMFLREMAPKVWWSRHVTQQQGFRGFLRLYHAITFDSQGWELQGVVSVIKCSIDFTLKDTAWKAPVALYELELRSVKHQGTQLGWPIPVLWLKAMWDVSSLWKELPCCSDSLWKTYLGALCA